MAIANLGLIIFMIFLEIVRKNTKKFDYLTLFNLIFLFSYPLPAFLLGVNLGTDHLSLDSKLYTGDIKTTYAIFIGYFVVVIGYYTKSAEKAGSNLLIKTTNHKKVIFLAIFLLLFSLLSIYIYGLQYGGIMVALAKTILIRQNLEESGSFVFFKNFMSFSYFASYLLASELFAKKVAKIPNYWLMKTSLAILFLLSVFISVLSSLLSSSRASLIYYLVGFYLAYILKARKIFSVSSIPIMLFIFVFILYGKAILFSFTALPDGLDSVVSRFYDSMQDKQAESDNESLLYEVLANFAFPLDSLHGSLNNDYDLRLFTDLINAFTALIPERVFNIQKPPSISDHNTFIVLGNVDYSVPAGILAFGIYSFSWFGLIIVCFIYGWIGRYLQTALNKHIDNISWVAFIYILTALQWIDFIPSGDPTLSLKGGLSYLISMILLLSSCSKLSISSPKIVGLKS